MRVVKWVPSTLVVVGLFLSLAHKLGFLLSLAHALVAMLCITLAGSLVGVAFVEMAPMVVVVLVVVGVAWNWILLLPETPVAFLLQYRTIKFPFECPICIDPSNISTPF